MNLFQRFFETTPQRNKSIGRLLSSISGTMTAIEGVLIAYNTPVPAWLHGSVIFIAIVTAIWAGYHGQKVLK